MNVTETRLSVALGVVFGSGNQTVGRGEQSLQDVSSRPNEPRVDGRAV
jgi:hypothetical protein